MENLRTSSSISQCSLCLNKKNKYLRTISSARSIYLTSTTNKKVTYIKGLISVYTAGLYRFSIYREYCEVLLLQEISLFYQKQGEV